MKKITIAIPTVETIETVLAGARKNAQAWMLETISEQMMELASLGKTKLTLDYSKSKFSFTHFDLSEVQNELREIGYMTTVYPRKEEIVVDWSESSRRELKRMKETNAQWKFQTEAEWKKEFNALRTKYSEIF